MLAELCHVDAGHSQDCSQPPGDGLGRHRGVRGPERQEQILVVTISRHLNMKMRIDLI